MVSPIPRHSLYLIAIEIRRSNYDIYNAIQKWSKPKKVACTHTQTHFNTHKHKYTLNIEIIVQIQTAPPACDLFHSKHAEEDVPSTSSELRALPHATRPVCAIFTHSLERNGANNFCLYIARPLSLWGGGYIVYYILVIWNVMLLFCLGGWDDVHG